MSRSPLVRVSGPGTVATSVACVGSCWMSPAPAPLVAVAWRLDDRRARLLTAHGDEGAGVAILDPNFALEAAILAESYVSGARHGIVLPCSFPGERDASLGGLAAHVRQQAVHAQPIRGAGQRQQGRPERVEELGSPLRCLSDPPPTVVLRRDRVVGAHASAAPGWSAGRCGHHGSARLAQ